LFKPLEQTWDNIYPHPVSASTTGTSHTHPTRDFFRKKEFLGMTWRQLKGYELMLSRRVAFERSLINKSRSLNKEYTACIKERLRRQTINTYGDPKECDGHYEKGQ
jgi:hypothetical protein